MPPHAVFTFVTLALLVSCGAAGVAKATTLPTNDEQVRSPVLDFALSSAEGAGGVPSGKSIASLFDMLENFWSSPGFSPSPPCATALQKATKLCQVDLRAIASDLDVLAAQVNVVAAAAADENGLREEVKEMLETRAPSVSDLSDRQGSQQHRESAAEAVLALAERLREVIAPEAPTASDLALGGGVPFSLPPDLHEVSVYDMAAARASVGEACCGGLVSLLYYSSCLCDEGPLGAVIGSEWRKMDTQARAAIRKVGESQCPGETYSSPAILQRNAISDPDPSFPMLPSTSLSCSFLVLSGGISLPDFEEMQSLAELDRTPVCECKRNGMGGYVRPPESSMRFGNLTEAQSFFGTGC